MGILTQIEKVNLVAASFAPPRATALPVEKVRALASG
jgi:hypothetical protein